MGHPLRCLPAPRPGPADPAHRPDVAGSTRCRGALAVRCPASRTAPPVVLLVALGVPLFLGACSATLPPLPTPPAVPARFSEDAPRTPPDAAAAPQPDGAWWRVFDDPRLDALQQQAMSGNPHIAEAAALTRQAQAMAAVAAADSRPQLALEAGASRQGGLLLNDAGSSGSLFRAGLALQFAPDLGGGRAAAVQAARHDLAQRQVELQHTRLQVQVAVVRHWLDAQAAAQDAHGLQAQADHWHYTARIEQRRHAAGLAPASAADAAQAQAAATLVRQQAVLQQLAQHRHALTALLGGNWPAGLPPIGLDGVAPAVTAAVPPSKDSADPLQGLPTVPVLADGLPALVIPPGLPSQLLARRPDVAAAGQAVQAARQRLGAAQASDWPSLLLTGAGGVASDDLGALLRSAARSWSLAGLLSLPLIDSGRRDARRAEAEAALDAAVARWRGQMLQALREVDDQLSAQQALGAQAASLTASVEAADQAVRLQRSLLDRGLTSPLALLDAQRRLIDDRLALARIQAARRQAALALVHALGGGWGAADTAAGPTATAPARSAVALSGG